MKKITALLLTVLLAVSLCACGGKSGDQGTTDGEKVYKIGIIQLSEHAAMDAAREGFLDGLDEAGIKYEVDVQNAQGEQSVCATIATKFVNDGVDLIMAIATQAAQAAAQSTDEIPILITAVTDPASSGLVNSNELPGTNVSGTSDMNPIEAQIELLLKFVPDAQTVGIMYRSSEDNSILQAAIARKALEAKGVTVIDFTAADSSEVQSVAQSAVGKVDAIYMPTDNLMADTISATSVILTQAGIPIIAGESNMVNNGGLATYGLDYYTLGKMTAAMAVRVLVNGEDIAAMPIEYAAEDELSLTVNEETLNSLGLTMPEGLE